MTVAKIWTRCEVEVEVIYSTTRYGSHVVSFVGCPGLASERFEFGRIEAARAKWAELVSALKDLGFNQDW